MTTQTPAIDAGNDSDNDSIIKPTISINKAPTPENEKPFRSNQESVERIQSVKVRDIGNNNLDSTSKKTYHLL